MAEPRTRKPVYQNYYTDEDYDDVMSKLPDIIKDAERKAGEILEPTVYEKRKVMDIIKDYIKRKERIVYGGTAINEILKEVNPKDAIYDDYSFSDIEFYSPTPVPDLVELTNLLHQKGFKYIQGKEAQHEETYSIFVNLQLYCDISYVPKRIYNGIKPKKIDGIIYADPHFILIDMFRVFNSPLTAAQRLWEKVFKRMYKILKNYPLEYFNQAIKFPKINKDIQEYISKIKSGFMGIKEIQEYTLIGGFSAYNFFIRHAAGDRTADQMARVAYDSDDVLNLIVNVPFLELISVNYRETVYRLYDFVKNMVDDPKEVTLEEYFPLFQFTGYSVFVKYKNIPLVRVYDTDGFCVPNIKTTNGYMYVSYQYLLMMMFINKFRSFLDKDREMYFNYGIAISNLVNARNVYLNREKIGIINNTVFGEFKIGCVGTTSSYTRVSLLRRMEKRRMGKLVTFVYEPQNFIDDKGNSIRDFDPNKHFFRNTSGNIIRTYKNLLFKTDADGNIIKNAEIEENYENSEEPEEQKNEN